MFSLPRKSSAFFLGLAISSAAVANFNQQETMIAAQKANKAAADESLQHSATSAMKALMSLRKHNRAEALRNGYQAYGKYRNSEGLDVARLQSAISTLKMDSVATELPQRAPWRAPPLSDFVTSFKRIDGKFLRTGEAGRVADEFEKQSGMKREDFLKILAKASDNRIYPDDPQLVDKVLSRFEGFVKEIPNRSFRAEVEKEIRSVPAVVRTGIVAKAVTKFSSLFANSNQSGANFSIIAEGRKDVVSKPSAVAPPERTVSSVAAAETQPGEKSDGSADKKNPNVAFESALRYALERARDPEQKNDISIFQQVTRRYRILSPHFSMNSGGRD